MTDDVLLVAEGVAAAYGRRAVLRDVTVHVPRAAVTAFVGANGSGKTTLLRVLLGLLTPAAGRVRFTDGRRPRTGYVPQIDVSETLFPVTAQQVVLMGATPALGPLRRSGEAERAAAHDALARMDVADLAALPFRDLSGGQRQRVLLARALVSSPELLVLDEPVRGLDFASSAALMEAIVAFSRQRGASVVMATHSLDLVVNHADQVALFRDGRVVDGAADALLDDATLTAHHGRPVIVREVEGRRVVLPGPAETD